MRCTWLNSLQLSLVNSILFQKVSVIPLVNFEFSPCLTEFFSLFQLGIISGFNKHISYWRWNFSVSNEMQIALGIGKTQYIHPSILTLDQWQPFSVCFFQPILHYLLIISYWTHFLHCFRKYYETVWKLLIKPSNITLTTYLPSRRAVIPSQSEIKLI